RVRLEPAPRIPQRVRVWRVPSAYSLKLVGGMALGGLVLILILHERPIRFSAPPKAIVVRAFLVFKIGSPQEKDPATSIYFNTQLSRVQKLKVYSQEHFDFEVGKRNLPEIEVARHLGIEKMIYGSVLTDGTRLHIEAHVNKVENGEMEATEFVEGDQKDLFPLLQQLAIKIMLRLNVVPPIEKPEQVAPNLDAYKKMLEGEGETPVAAPPEGESVPSQSSHDKKKEQYSWVPLWQGWREAGVAWAEEAPLQSHTPEEEIRYALEKYRQAYEKRDVTMLEDVYATFTAAQRQANTEYFQNTQNLRVTIRDVVISVSGDEAAVSYNRE